MMHSIMDAKVKEQPKEEEVERFEATLDDIFNESFMQAHTHVHGIGEFFMEGGFLPEDMQQIDALPKDELDAYVAANTDFGTWSEMLGCAVNLLLVRMEMA